MTNKPSQSFCSCCLKATLEAQEQMMSSQSVSIAGSYNSGVILPQAVSEPKIKMSWASSDLFFEEEKQEFMIAVYCGYITLPKNPKESIRGVIINGFRVEIDDSLGFKEIQLEYPSM